MMNIAANLPKGRFRCEAIGLNLNLTRLAPVIFVKKLKECERDSMLTHFLGLNDADRLLRFGTVLPDCQVVAYVDQIDFSRDTVYGVYSDRFSLVAVGHLAFAPVRAGDADKESMAELGVSVDRSMRRLGLGRKLFERAIMHCRNAGVDTLYSHCLSSNQALMHIVKNSGFQIQRDHSEADAYLNLLPPDAGTVVQEVIEEQFATLDYAFKANTSASETCLSRAFQIGLIVAALLHMHGLLFLAMALASHSHVLPAVQRQVTESGVYQ